MYAHPFPTQRLDEQHLNVTMTARGRFMAREPRTKSEQQTLLLRSVLAAERDGELHRVALHAHRARLAACVTSSAGIVLSLLTLSNTDQQVANMVLLWVVFVLTFCRALNEVAYAASAARSQWLVTYAARPLIAATLIALAWFSWHMSTLPASLLGSAAALDAYSRVAFVQVRAMVVAAHDTSRPLTT
jgi:hypothetical protein